MKKINSLFLALLMVFAINGLSWGWGGATGDGSDYKMLQETAVFFNNSGGSLSTGDVVILDTAGTGVTADTTLGGYVTTTASADSVLVVGVVLSASVADQRPVVVVTKGVARVFCQDNSDAVSINTAVGSTTLAKQCGGGTNLGIALEAGTGNNSDLITVWISPTGAD